MCLQSQMRTEPFHPTAFILSRVSSFAFINVSLSSTLLTIVRLNLRYHLLALSDTDTIKLATHAVSIISFAISRHKRSGSRIHSGIRRALSIVSKMERCSGLSSSSTLAHGTALSRMREEIFPISDHTLSNRKRGVLSHLLSVEMNVSESLSDKIP